MGVGKIALKIAGLLVGLASYRTVASSLAKPIESNSSRSYLIAMSEDDGKAEKLSLFDFTAPNADVSGWIESSDTVRQPGMSKATIVIQSAQLFQRAIFFALLNPQPNGAGFAGVRHPTKFDLSRFTSISIKLRAQGLHKNFKIVLKHHEEVGDGSPSYENFFTAPEELQIITLALSDFKPYWRGKPLENVDPLDTANITSFGIQYYGGVYEEDKQSGPVTLEIDWIHATMD